MYHILALCILRRRRNEFTEGLLTANVDLQQVFYYESRSPLGFPNFFGISASTVCLLIAIQYEKVLRSIARACPASFL